jgi:CII-binding regulator of phage lambda lysogenization HflD
MTDEEINRKFDVVAGHLATLATSLQKSDERQDRTDAQIAETSRQISAYAETQSEFLKIATGTMEYLAEAQIKADARIAALAEAQGHTDARLNVLIGVVEKYFSNGRNGK